MATVVAVPLLHRLHHARYGADYQHTALGTVYAADTDEEAAPDEAAHHAAFDADLAALELSEVAHAGAMVVECDYARFTLAACPTSSAPSHPHTFGDELLARAHQHRAPGPFDSLPRRRLARAPRRVAARHVRAAAPAARRARAAARGLRSIHLA